MLSITVLGAFYFLYVSVINPPKDNTEIRNENAYLKSKLESLLGNYQEINKQVDSLRERNKYLRVASNLPVIDNEQMQLGIGGKATASISDIIEGRNPDMQAALSEVDLIIKKFEFERDNMSEIQAAISRNKSLYKAIPAIKPCEGELASHGFGMRLHPILGVVRMHEGVDIMTETGTPVLSGADGVVEFTGGRNGLGLCVEINHGFGYRTIYGHLSKTIAKEGQRVTRGTQIALTGNTGLSSGPHLHYEVIHNGTHIDPEQFFFNDYELFSSN